MTVVASIPDGAKSPVPSSFPPPRGAYVFEFDRPPRVLGVEDLHRRLADENVLIVDVRSPEQCVDGHVPGARLLPYAELVTTRGDAAGALPDPDRLSAIFSASACGRTTTSSPMTTTGAVTRLVCCGHWTC